jgi:hypothetical protein
MAFTPVAKQLQQRLEDRRAQFRSWMFQWHKLKEPNGLVEVDLFDGRFAHMGGVEFSGSARDTFWDAITRGARKEILEQLAWVDEQARRYNQETAISSIDQAAGLLISFAHGVRRDAIEKDRLLRGNGITLPTEDDGGYWYGTSAQEITSYAESLKSALPFSTPEVLEVSHSPNRLPSRLNRLWHDNQWWLGPVGLVTGLLGLIALL